MPGHHTGGMSSSHLLHSPESVLKTPERRLAGSPGVHSAHSALRSAHAHTTSPSTHAHTGLKRADFGPGKTPNDGAISNFFPRAAPEEDRLYGSPPSRGTCRYSHRESGGANQAPRRCG